MALPMQTSDSSSSDDESDIGLEAWVEQDGIESVTTHGSDDVDSKQSVGGQWHQRRKKKTMGARGDVLKEG